MAKRLRVSVAAAGASLAFALALSMAPGVGRAANIASDNASNSAYTGSWPNSSNGGSGWGGGWALTNNGNSSQSGQFVGTSAANGNGSSGNIDTTGQSWGMYANSGAVADAVRPFSGNLTAGQVFAIDFDNGFIQNGGIDGVNLQTSAGANRLEFTFTGGQSNYIVTDSTGTRDTGIGFTPNGLRLVFTLTGTDTYSLGMTPAGGSTTTLTGTLEGAAGSGVGRVRAFDNSAGNNASNNLYVNSISITPEPAGLGLLGAAGLALLTQRRRA